MYFPVAEVIPPPALAIPIGTLLLWGVFLALCLGVSYVAKAFFGLTSGTLGKLPVVGGWINSSAHNIERKLTSTLAQASAHADAQVGAALHSLARIIDHVGHEIEAHSNLIAVLGQVMLGHVAGPDFWNQIGRLIRSHNATTKQVGAIQRRQVATDKRIGHGIGADVIPRVKTLEREVSHVIEHDVASLRARTRTLERDYARLYKWGRRHTLTAGTLAFTGAVAWSLGRLGMGWLRCPSFLRIGSRIGCGGFGALEEILFAGGEALVVTDICAFAGAATAVAEALRPALMELVDVENALVGCHGATRPPTLKMRALSLPPVTEPLPLAA